MSQFPQGYGKPPFYSHKRKFKSTAQSQYNTPVQFHNPCRTGGVNPVLQFYGQLLDPFGYPSEILSRLSDALFFFIDQNCPCNCGTGVMIPDKLYWESMLTEPSVDSAQLLTAYNNIGSLYDSVHIPYSLNAYRAPVLNRRGFLHLSVFEARAAPDECHKTWNKRINILKLIDPMTNKPFPTPIPRQAFPLTPDSGQRNLFISWATSVITKYQQEKRQAQYAQIMGAPPETRTVSPTETPNYSTQLMNSFIDGFMQGLGLPGSRQSSSSQTGGTEGDQSSIWASLAAQVIANILTGNGGDFGSGFGN